jgi:hypothetical protein
MRSWSEAPAAILTVLLKQRLIISGTTRFKAWNPRGAWAFAIVRSVVGL